MTAQPHDELAQSVANIEALIDWTEKDGDGSGEFFRYDGYVLTLDDLRRAAKALRTGPSPDGYGGMPLRCPYCGDEIEVETSEHGYYRDTRVDAIVCSCGGRWSPSTGEVDAIPIAWAACPTHGPHPMTVDCPDCLIGEESAGALVPPGRPVAESGRTPNA